LRGACLWDLLCLDALDCEQSGGFPLGGCRLPNQKSLILTAMNLMKSLSILGFSAFATAGFALGQAVTTPVGYVTIECKASSDTIVGVPLRQYAAYAGTLGADPEVGDPLPEDVAVLTLSGSPALDVDAFADTHYVKFTNGTGNGQWFVITENDADSLTIKLNGGTINAVSGDQLEVIKFWTLAELFNPADSTTSTNPVTTKNAIVASTSLNAFGRRTQLLIPDYAAGGTNISTKYIFFIHNSIWKLDGALDTDYGEFKLWPDSYFIIRNPILTSSTYYTSTGEVESNNLNIDLHVLPSGKRDNLVSLPRPVDVSLEDLKLGNTPAFASSTSLNAFGRKDEILVFDNAVVSRNKSASAIYFYFNGWRKQGDTVESPLRNSDIIPAGWGFIVRKHQSAGGTVFWNNEASY